jgi:hypothetical protein
MAFGNRVELVGHHDVEVEIGPLVPGSARDRAEHADGQHAFVLLIRLDDRPQQRLVPGRAWQGSEKDGMRPRPLSDDLGWASKVQLVYAPPHKAPLSTPTAMCVRGQIDRLL